MKGYVPLNSQASWLGVIPMPKIMQQEQSGYDWVEQDPAWLVVGSGGDGPPFLKAVASARGQDRSGCEAVGREPPHPIAGRGK